MFKLFNSKEVKAPSLEVEQVLNQEVVIDSNYIQGDLRKSFKEVLSKLGLKESRESEILGLEEKLSEFKKNNELLYSKIDKLNMLGLNNTPSAKLKQKELSDQEGKLLGDIASIEFDINEARRISDLNTKYSFEYAGYRFVDKQTMIDVMKKYDLFMGESSMYSREIPDKSVDIISNFTKAIKESSSELILTECSSISFRSYSYNIQSREVFNTTQELNRNNNYFDYSIISEITVSAFKMVAPLSHFDFPTITKIDMISGRDKVIPIVDINPLTNIIEYSVKGLNDFAKQQREVLDPIACLEVEGGYIIMDAWDKEADIPEIKNNLLN